MRNAAAEKLLGITNSTGMSLSDDAFGAYMDEQDPLRDHRACFHLPQTREGDVYSYLAGNALGPQHVGVEGAVSGYLKKWQQQAAEGHFMQPSPWSEIDEAVRKDMSALVGANASEVVMMNSLTVNIHVMMCAFYRPSGTRKKILMENQGFPSDTHALTSQLELHGFNPADDLITVAAPGHEDWSAQPTIVPTESFLSAIERHGDEIAIIVLGAVHFLTGQYFDIAAIVKAAHEKNIIVGLDCAHAAGNVPLQLHDWGVDFACWCTYKYLSGGPGNVAAAFVHSKHTLPGSKVKYLKGWWGHERKNRLSLHRAFDAAEGAGAFQISSTNVVGVTTLAPAVKLMATVGMPALREKSLQLTAYLELLLNELVPQGCIEIVTTADPAFRGAQLSIRLLPNKLASDTTDTEGYEFGTSGLDGNCDAVIAQRQLLDLGVMVDSCPPDILCVAPAPMFNNYTDVLLAVRALSSLF